VSLVGVKMLIKDTISQKEFKQKRLDELARVANDFINNYDVAKLEVALKHYNQSDYDYDELVLKEERAIAAKISRDTSKLDPAILDRAYALHESISAYIAKDDQPKWRQLYLDIVEEMKKNRSLLEESESMLWFARSIAMITREDKIELIKFLWPICLTGTMTQSARLGSLIFVTTHSLSTEDLITLRPICTIEQGKKYEYRFIQAHDAIHKNRSPW
jgi:hypothetical protein